MEKQLSRFDELLADFKYLDPIELPEVNIFSIGGRGYYENPTTDLLAFFCDCNAEHGLDDTVLRALISCLPEELRSLDCSLVESPEREVACETGSRIDLLLESNDWAIILENKIYHEQNNPFLDYENFVKEDTNLARFKDKDIVYVVLSPSGEISCEGWHGVSYTNLILALKSALSETLFLTPINKWTFLLREFIMHLESIMSKPLSNKQTTDFVLNNLTAIKDIQDTRKKVIKEYHEQLQFSIQGLLQREVIIRTHNWDGYPALRFSLGSWPDLESDVVLYLSDKKGDSSINVHVYLENESDQKVADSIILQNFNGKVEKWVEGQGRYRGYSVGIEGINKDDLTRFLSKRLEEVDQYITKK